MEDRTMIKKNYEKPSMKVYEMKPARIICTSGGNDPDYWGYNTPAIDNDMNHLA